MFFLCVLSPGKMGILKKTLTTLTYDHFDQL